MLRSVTTLPKLPSRPKDSHKGTFGKVLIVAGSTGMSGAAILAGLGALRGGAGLVRVCCPAPIHPLIAGAQPCWLTTALPADTHGMLSVDANDPLKALLSDCRAVAFGPGLGKSQAITEILHTVITQFEGQVVIDADGLPSFQQLLNENRVPDRKIPLICTPHPGEFASMTGLTTQHVQSDRKQQAIRFSLHHKVIVVLKGQGTVVTDGQRVYVNTTGNPGMAKGGSGDVLVGLIASLAAQGMPPLEAAQAGVYLHGLSGDLASAALSEQAMLPTDLVDSLGLAFKKYTPGN